jgi:hypothetical protein
MKRMASLSMGSMRSFVATACVVSASCGGVSATADRWDAEVRDSAGLRIVENGARGLWAEGSEWTVRPALSVGGEPGETDDLVAVADLAIDSRGRVLSSTLSRVRCACSTNAANSRV